VGRKFRLGSEEELGPMLKASKTENTLDSWAGYAVNADDERRLASLVDGLGAGALLKPVGSYPGTGDEPLFDLGGNVAEWVTAKDGTGKAMGGSADRPADAKSTAKARPAYVGFRVVAE
jgi:formylglycine-generating enzyme required for sulfatase activity